MVTKASTYLFEATEKRFFFKNVSILIPESWKDSPQYRRPKQESYKHVSIKFSSNNNKKSIFWCLLALLHSYWFRVFLITVFSVLQVLTIFLNILRLTLKWHLPPLRAEMSPTPGNSHSVKRKQNTSTSPLTLYWGENKLNMEIQVGNLAKALHDCDM